MGLAGVASFPVDIGSADITTAFAGMLGPDCRISRILLQENSSRARDGDDQAAQ